MTVNRGNGRHAEDITKVWVYEEKDLDMLDTPDAARETRLSVSYLNKLRGTDLGPPFVKIGRRVLYRRKDLEKWLSAKLRTSTSNAGLFDAG